MVESILEAATRVLAAESLAGFNTNRVAEIAGVSIGSLYQYFPNKAALAAALIEREQLALCRAVEECVADHRGRPLSTILRALVAIAIAHQFGNPVYAAALDHEERRLPLENVIGAARRRIIEAIEVLLERYRTNLAEDLPAAAARDCLVIVKALVESEASESRDAHSLIEDRVMRALIGYLGYRHRRAR